MLELEYKEPIRLTKSTETKSKLDRSKIQFIKELKDNRLKHTCSCSPNEKVKPNFVDKDLKGTISFYESVLGFKGKSNFPNFVSLTMENVEIMFIVPQDEPQEDNHLHEKEEFFLRPALTDSIFTLTDEVDKLWESVRKRATVKTSIDDRAILCGTFQFSTTNGYELVFGQDISSSKHRKG